MPRLLNGRGPRRKAEHDAPPGAINRAAEHFDFMRRGIGGRARRACARDVIDLDVIHAPCGIQLKQTVVICLRGRTVRACAEHIAVPFADGVRHGDLVCRRVRAPYRRAGVNRLPRNAAHDMDAEFHPHRMNLRCNRGKTLAAGRGWKAVLRREQPPVFVHAQLCERDVFASRSRAGRRLVPLDVAYNVFPAERQQLFGLIAGV